MGLVQFDTDDYASCESSQHREAKELIAEMARENGGRFLVAMETPDRFLTSVLDVSLLDVVVECGPFGEQILDPNDYKRQRGRYPGYIFDVGFAVNGRVLAAIEVVKTSSMTHEKIAKVVESGTLCIAVKADWRSWHVDSQRIEAIQVIRPKNALIGLSPMRI